MPEEILNQADIGALVRQHVPGAVAEHVRVDTEWRAGDLGGAPHDPGDHVRT